MGGSWCLPPGERGHCNRVCTGDRFAPAKNRSRPPFMLNGHVQLSCVLGEGTTTRIVLPLTLASLAGMTGRLRAVPFILPLHHVNESLPPSHDQMYTDTGDGRGINVAGGY